MQTAVYFLSGALTLGYTVAALFFLRFYRQAADRLFAFFAAAFALLAIQRVLTIALRDTAYPEVAYVVRLAAFVLILIAIWDKNRAARA
jgi:zinc transporter ZupT